MTATTKAACPAQLNHRRVLKNGVFLRRTTVPSRGPIAWPRGGAAVVRLERAESVSGTSGLGTGVRGPCVRASGPRRADGPASWRQRTTVVKLPHSQRAKPLTRGAVVLVAEDDENDVLLLRLAFKRAGLGHSIVSVPNGKEAVSYLAGDLPYADRTRHPLPQLVLLDLKMPVMHGFDVLAWLRTQPDLRHRPVVVLSSSGLQSDMDKARRLGAADYRVKPASLEQLIDLVRELAERWLG